MHIPTAVKKIRVELNYEYYVQYSVAALVHLRGDHYYRFLSLHQTEKYLIYKLELTLQGSLLAPGGIHHTYKSIHRHLTMRELPLLKLLF